MDEAGERARQWSADLASWALPQEIVDQAEQPPWSHPVGMFTVGDEIADAPSHRIARAAMPAGGSVLDVGCGGGRGALALVPPAGEVVGVDHQQAMLDAFASAAERRGVSHREILGDWPEAESRTPVCDVVVCHHVAFNVADIVPFVAALDSHARSRVVLELPMQHPLSTLNPLWEHFWGITRPTRPTADDLLELVKALGHDARMERWLDPEFGSRSGMSIDERIDMTRIRLCLPVERRPELAALLAASPPERPRELATIWWDVHR